MTRLTPLSPQQLKQACDPDSLQFSSTAELESLDATLGQDRAMAALDFGINIDVHGYNIYAHGPAGYGKHTIIRRLLEQYPTDHGDLYDWCYVNNFNLPQKPSVLKLPAGIGHAFSRDMSHTVRELHLVLPAAFESDEYNARLQELQDDFKTQHEEAFRAFEAEANKHDVALLPTRTGFALAPSRDGEVIKPEEFQKLPEEQRNRIEEVIEILQEQLAQLIRQEPRLQRNLRDRIRELNREFAGAAVEHLIQDLRKLYQSHENILAYLDRVQADVVENVEEFLNQEDKDTMVTQQSEDAPSYRRYQINLLVDNQDTRQPPIIYEDTPTYQNLIGKVEHLAHFGTLVTDFLLVKPGALHRANGGYLLLDASKLLTSPFAYESLKRALQAREIRIQALSDLYSFTSTLSLEPEPIPLNIKVVLIGERLLYYLLQSLDPEFSELFKVTADFEENIDRTPDTHLLYARMIARLIQEKSLLPFDNHAIAHIIDYAARLAEDQEKLSIHMHHVNDLLSEANYWARKQGADIVGREHVIKAITEKITRVSRVRDEAQEEIRRGTLFLDSAGEHVGRVNGLMILDLGDFRFGHPARITATVNIGEGNIIDIEREVELGGPIHSKGVMILSAYLSAKYAVNRPLSLAGHIVFEQSYAMVEGDSASAAELCALLSAIADLPVSQAMAITGSINQHGEIQPIGGVNDKIEGFFDICRQRGFSQGQAVIIPSANVKHLMLKDDVINAVNAGEFQVYAVNTVDDIMELLSGKSMGEPDKDGNYPPDSINAMIEQRLSQFAEIRQEHNRQKDDDDS